MYDTMESLMKALSRQLQIVSLNRKIDRPRFEMPPCPNLENVICGVVARFVHNFVPVTMSN